MKKFLVAALSLISIIALADAPVIWSGSTAKWLPSGLNSAGLGKISSTGVQTSGAADLSNSAEITGTLPNANTTATSANTASTIVARDGSGNFSAGTITAALSGNASTATAFFTNPTDCGAGDFANAIDASGNLTCATPSSGWGLTGNSGTTAGTNFVGTTDAQDVVIKRNSAEKIRATSAGATVTGVISATQADLNSPTVTSGALNLKAKSDTLGQHIVLESANGANDLYLNYRDNKDIFLYDSGGNMAWSYSYATRSFTVGQGGGDWHIQSDYGDSDTTPATPSRYSAVGITNTDTTDGNHGVLAFVGSQGGLNPDSAIFGIHDDHNGASSSGSLEFWTRNAGTFARAVDIALNKIVTMDAYTTGIAHFDASGVISSSAVDLASADVTGVLPNAKTTAASANTASAIVARDGSGNFTATTITAALTGNASTATSLAANPTDCGAGTKATGIDASGNLTCSAVSLTADVSGTLPVANGGTGQTTYTDGQLLIGNTTGNTLTKSTLTAGSGITITNGGGSITIASSGSSSSGLVGIMQISGCSSGNFDTTSTSYAALGTSTGCTYTATNGSGTFTTPGTNVAGFTTTSIPAGTYQITYTGAVTNNNSNGKACYFQFSDGTTTANEEAETINATQTHTTPTFVQTITFGSTASHTIDIRGKMESGGNGNCRIGGDVNGTRIGSQTITMVRIY